MKTLLGIIALLISCLSFGQTENFWTKKSDFSGFKRERAVAFTISGYAYVGTGVDTAENVRDDFWKYDPVLDSWAQVATLPGSARRDAVAFTANDKGYVGTGIDNDNANFGTILTDFWEYDPAANSWAFETNYPLQAVYFATAFSINNKGYVVCGKMGPNWYSDNTLQYDPITGQWAQGADFPGGVRYQLSSFVIENSAYVGLGTDNDMYRADIWQYKPSQNLWTAKDSLPASMRASSHTFTIGNYGYICMGANGGYLDDLWEYNPYDNTWAVKSDYGGSKRKNGVAFTLNGKGYVGTGKGYSGKKGSFWEYTPSSYVGIKELEDISFGVYPNPAKNLIHINSNAEIESIEIYSMTGSLITKSQFVNSIPVDASPGAYLVVAKGIKGEVLAQQKLLIQ